MLRKYFGIRLVPVILLYAICLGTYVHIKTNYKFFNLTEAQVDEVFGDINDNFLAGSTIFPNEQICEAPTLNVSVPDIEEVLQNASINTCHYLRDWVEVEGSTAKISDWALKTVGYIECSFMDILRKNDSVQYAGKRTMTHTKYKFKRSDVVKVHCEGNGETWEKVLLGVREDQNILNRTTWDKVPRDSLKLNVLIFGLGSLSHNMWKRKLPKTYDYAINELGGIPLNNYNILRGGTPYALIPILTGKNESELPETREWMNNAQYLNVYPFIWKKYQKNGYVTMFAEDQPKTGTFKHRFKGFNEQPTDHYIKPFYMEASPSFDENMHCYGQLSQTQIIINYIKDMYKTYEDKPKFIFTFHSTYTDGNLEYASTVDEETVKFLKEFQEKELFSDTLLILMSDHGSRFSDIRNCEQGRQEERLPGFIIVFPSWFKRTHPEAFENLKINSDRLTTPYDVHQLLKNVLHFRGAGLGSTKHRGISLFREVPLNRSCLEAQIVPYWCACLHWEIALNFNPLVKKAAYYLVQYINNITSEYRHLCKELKLKKIRESASLLPNLYLFSAKKSDWENYLNSESNYVSLTTKTYQIKVTLSPGDMLFEASIRYLANKSEYVGSETSISRLDANSSMTHCLENKDIYHRLRKYCYCN